MGRGGSDDVALRGSHCKVAGGSEGGDGTDAVPLRRLHQEPGDGQAGLVLTQHTGVELAKCLQAVVGGHLAEGEGEDV